MKRVLLFGSLAALVALAPSFAACTQILGVTGIPSGTSAEGGADGSTNEFILASNIFCPRFLAVDSLNVYWVSAQVSIGSVYSCGINGCQNTPTVLAKNQDTPEGIATDGQNVYWATNGTNNSALRACATGGCNSLPRQLNVSNGLPYGFFGVALFDGTLYATAEGQGQVVSVLTSATAATPNNLLPLNVPTPTPVYETIVTDGVTVYFTQIGPGTSQVLSCPVSGCTTASPPTVVATPANPPRALASANAALYWMTTDNGITVQSCTTGGAGNCDKSTAMLYQSSGTKVSNPEAWGLTVDSTYIYFTDGSDDTIKRCSNLGCKFGQTTIATGAKYASGLVTDPSYIYWGTNEPGCTGSGTVTRLPKPGP